MNPYESPNPESDAEDRMTDAQPANSPDRTESGKPLNLSQSSTDSSRRLSRTFSVTESAAEPVMPERDRTSPSSPSPETQNLVNQLLRDSLKELEKRRNTLRLEVEQLERRRDRIQTEMRQSFAGVSQDLAVRVQGFKDYLVGSLQDLAIAAEQLELAPPQQPAPKPAPPSPIPQPSRQPAPAASTEAEDMQPRFTDERFQRQIRRIRALLDQYRTRPEYYGPPWQLRRTFEPIHAERVSNWFFKQGGRGAVRSMGSRLQNVLVTSAVISILKDIYQDRLGVLILTDTPERLGEWRRGLQDCLGIARMDFNIEQGVVLFEAPEPLAQRAERMMERGMLPLIVVDEAEGKIDLSILQFPLWLAFAPNPAPLSSNRPPERDRYFDRPSPDRFGSRF
ncbi:MAG: DUF3086 domain-containing protein [Thainema sp.]